MSLGRALVYFLAEALTGLGRSWKVSLLAILTIAASVFVGGVFLLVTGNLARIAAEWRSDARIVVYLVPDAGDQDLGRLSVAAAAEAWVERVESISRTEAEERFAAVYPELSSLLGDFEEAPLPPSLEISYDGAAAPTGVVRRWLESVAADPSVQVVDDDRQWLGQLDLLIAVVRGIGLVVGALLLAAAILTIASVVRLSAHFHREEIAIMRLIGATELFIRGPFLAGGLIQGTLGGGLALLGLATGFQIVRARSLPTVMGSTLFGSFLPLPHLMGLVVLGALAGLLGASLSLRR